MSFTKTAELPVSPDEAFALLTEPERLRRWQTVSAYVDLRAGGDYRWTVSPGHVAAGTFREIEPGRRIVFGWGWLGSDDLPPDASTVTVILEPTDAGSKVTLIHEGLTEEQEKLHAEGWNHYFERLARLVVSGDAGPDEWAWAPEDLTPVTAAEAVLAAIAPVLRNLTPEDRAKPTPCEEFTAHDVGQHLLDSIAQLGAMAGGSVVNPEQGSLENRVAVTAAQAIDAWRLIDLDGTVPGPGGDMPASFAATILPLELALHGWDLAQASGQEIRISDELVGYLRTAADGLVPGGRANGSFGPEVTAPDDATRFDRLAAFAGRTPTHT
jgi:uncharacterized protein (TIGR03086 family)